MIEDILFLALGVCITTVLALACLPILWARALRLTRQRLELLVPWSKSEIDAERDGWRAQAAVQQRRLEQAAEKSRQTLMTRDIELGHRTAGLSRAEAARDELDAVRRALLAELGALGRELRDSEGQRGALEKALHDADRHIETDAAEARLQAQRYDRLDQLADERRGAIAALETRVAGLQAKVEDRDDAIAKLTTSEAEASASVAALRGALDSVRSDLAKATAEGEATARALSDERVKAVDRDARLRQRTDALTQAEERMAEQDATLRRKVDELAALQRRFDALERDLKARQEGSDAAHDAALRQAVTAAGDEALRLLAPETAQAVDTPVAGELVQEQR